MIAQRSPEFDLSEIVALAREAGAIAMRHFRRVGSDRKADNTIVTQADRDIEQFLVDELTRRYPHHGILGEEGAHVQREAPHQWVLDPIDGTSVFAAGLPVWAVCIGYMVDDRPVAGVVYLPITGDCFVAAPEGPALLDDRPLTAASPAPYT
ncbi:MAG: inositol monophosphatase, partial [Caldilineae bacterium]